MACKFIVFSIGLALALGIVHETGHAGEWGKYQVEDRRSGYTYRTKETRAMQDDDFQNPGMALVDEGEALWSMVDGKAGKSCASCHQDASVTMRGVGAVYPKFDIGLGKLKNIEQQINTCRTGQMQATPWKWEKGQLLAMTVYVRHQSRGMPMNVKVDGSAAPFFEKGKAFYNERRGQLDMSCGSCHEAYPGTRIRADMLSQGQGHSFPTYRLKWQKVGSLHRRFRGCNKQVRSKPYKYGSDEYVNLELYAGWRARGLPIETPALRN
ncbi:MAG: sulfur oxidation c-type cytochrome SoxA [Rhodospirillaceae bacterium TMED8]|nr:sulfur oxidation c-type cytochrome SoxA [Magnetovibrio sp.]OUT47823.1 MAG: sulfur oxidation c-type cytochrome SoxA [Rhodospirillaceae bacterium TMED8]|tara:strand:+ start:374 stop:1174 length:801 start_codon:yes stop_codon:yes gene_type:complete